MVQLGLFARIAKLVIYKPNKHKMVKSGDYKTTLTLFNSCSTMVLSHPSFYHGYVVHVLMEMTGQVEIG